MIQTLSAYDLPEGWTFSTLGEISTKPQYGWTTKANHESGKVKLLRTTDITSGKINWITVPYCTKEPDDLEKYLLKPGDIVISRAGSVGVSYLLTDADNAVFASYLIRFRPNEPLNKKYVYYYLKSPDYWKAIGKSTLGIAVPNVNATKLSKVKIPIAPVEEQKRIVAEIEKQFSRLDEAVDNLKRVKANLKRYKSSVLKAAVEGKLTEEWRKKNLPAPSSKPGKFYTYAILCENDSIYIGHTDDIERRWKQHLEGKGSEWTAKHKPVKIVHWEEFDTRKEAADREKWLKTGYGRKWLKREYAAGRTRQAGQVEPADKLLERILAERRMKWEEAELARLRERAARRQAKMKAKGKVPKDNKWKNKYKEPAKPEASMLSFIIDGWIWASVEQLAEIQLGKMLDRQKHRKGNRIMYLRNINVRWGAINTDDLLEMFFKGTELNRYGLKAGDVLVCEGGEPGRAAVWDGSFPDMKYQKALHRVRFYRDFEEQFLVYYLEFLSQTGRLKRWFTGSTIKHFTKESFSGLPVPVPPKDEQVEIVSVTEEHLSNILVLERDVDTNLIRADRLRQSILKKAFSGKLVPQGHNVELAANPLKRSA